MNVATLAVLLLSLSARVPAPLASEAADQHKTR